MYCFKNEIGKEFILDKESLAYSKNSTVKPNKRNAKVWSLQFSLYGKKNLNYSS
jgi:hypothetical protein